MMDADAYRSGLAALLPSGLPWPRVAESVLGRLLAAWADELARVDARAEALVAEALPTLTHDLLDDWERAYGLPDGCGAPLDDEGLRRAALVSKMIARGGQSRAYYLSLAAALGLSVELIEYRPHDVGCRVDAPLCGPDWAYAWALHLSAVTVYPLRADGRVDRPLAAWLGDAQAECLFRRLRPAHTILLFTYGS